MQTTLAIGKGKCRASKRGPAPLSLRRLAQESGVSLSVLAALHRGQSRRVDYTTIDQLLNYFNRYFGVTVNDLLTWEHALQDEVPLTLDASRGRAT
ncbi:helix-turn-helix transcriptional regulator [Ktedonobacter sp. SOSP1-85]|uniref:helix-turn-helix domain-containing protein n=1 Tax=Ktedonobacter sp. SOSP1-85 TaxID=2778367 RepID=UPI001F2BFE12|nr:helix-turn-helix transcriptional regulator [Ktedonobacter sp. SOSP1-85]